jgi:hypothetical protein
MVKEEDLLGAVVGVGGLCGGVGAGGEGGGIEARGVVVAMAGGAERRERVGVGVSVGVVRERRRGREAGAGLAPAPAEERAGEARADEDDEEDAEAEARQRQRHARRHAGPHRARGEWSLWRGGLVPSAGCRGSLSCCACAGRASGRLCTGVLLWTSCWREERERQQNVPLRTRRWVFGPLLGWALAACLQVCSNGRRYNTPHWYKIVEHILLL